MRNEQMNGKNRAWPAQAGQAIPARVTEPQPVWFEHSNSAAREVTIAGSFNNWDVSSIRMVHADRGRWVRVVFLPPGHYEYLFVVDGRCVADPRATESVPNVFGCMNSVLSVPARVSTNGCARRMTSRKPLPPPQSPVKSKVRPCRKVNATQHALGPNNRG
jgi:1,4-alpha-glucan branching enzyme